LRALPWYGPRSICPEKCSTTGGSYLNAGNRIPRDLPALTERPGPGLGSGIKASIEPPGLELRTTIFAVTRQSGTTWLFVVSQEAEKYRPLSWRELFRTDRVGRLGAGPTATFGLRRSRWFGATVRSAPGQHALGRIVLWGADMGSAGGAERVAVGL
jgi:hypothetical protein